MVKRRIFQCKERYSKDNFGILSLSCLLVYIWNCKCSKGTPNNIIQKWSKQIIFWYYSRFYLYLLIMQTELKKHRPTSDLGISVFHYVDSFFSNSRCGNTCSKIIRCNFHANKLILTNQQTIQLYLKKSNYGLTWHNKTLEYPIR